VGQTQRTSPPGVPPAAGPSNRAPAQWGIAGALRLRFGRRPIRAKILIGLSVLLLLVGLLAGGGLYTTYAYRGLVKSLSSRVGELPVAAELNHYVGDLRVTLGELHGLHMAYRLQPQSVPAGSGERLPARLWLVRDLFRSQVDEVVETLGRYRRQLDHKLEADFQIADNEPERKTVEAIQAALRVVRETTDDPNWMLEGEQVARLDRELARLQSLSAQLPSHLHTKLAGFSDEVRGEYRTLIVGTWLMSIITGLLLALLVHLFFRWVFMPLKVLINGSRRVAGGDFDHRIELNTGDEMAVLAQALNDMTARFQAIRDDLDRQVQERTKQVVRSEQLASVGFLAAGVAHEINNPLASIAMCAESLEGRLQAVFQARAAERSDSDSSPAAASNDATLPANSDDQVALRYLRMIQQEAFRCKEITEKLLDFARVGPTRRQEVEMGELVQGVIEMVRHIGAYQRAHIEFVQGCPLIVAVNPQEIKQVVLNLLTNALDSLDDAGSVTVTLAKRGDWAELIVADTGCGMDAEVLEHVFEPFFTRRRTGQRQGTGLGLSIAYRIVSDHGGAIEGESPGPDAGSTFRVRLPLAHTATWARAA